MSVGNCTVCGRSLATPDGAKAHAWKHICRANSILGRETTDYDEVRLVLGGRVDLVDGPQTSLARFTRDPAQATLADVDADPEASS